MYRSRRQKLKQKKWRRESALQEEEYKRLCYWHASSQTDTAVLYHFTFLFYLSLSIFCSPNMQRAVSTDEILLVGITFFTVPMFMLLTVQTVVDPYRIFAGVARTTKVSLYLC